MRHIGTPLVALLLLLGAAQARAGDMVLSRGGALLRVVADGSGLAISETSMDGTVTQSAIPETVGVSPSFIQIGCDEATGTSVVVWQEGEGALARVRLATLSAGAWYGPMTVAGGDGSSAANPSLLVDRPSTTVDENGESLEYATTIVHLAWWTDLETADGGVAVYGFVALDEYGAPDLSTLEPTELKDFTPYGLSCPTQDPRPLAQPRLFIDPTTGDANVLAVELGTCLFHIIRLRPELGPPDIVQRRRHTIVLDRRLTIALNPTLPMLNAHVEVGHGLSVVLYWDAANAVQYATLAESGWSELKTLPLSETLNHEQAIDLIRGLSE